MNVLEYGNPQNDKIILIHGFESPYQIFDDYIEHLQKDYCVIVPILPGHNPDVPEDFMTFSDCCGQLENYYINKHGTNVYAIYGMSMGGVLACHLWKNQNIKISKLILESSPLLSYGKIMTSLLTKQYLSATNKARQRNEKVLKQAINTMISEDKLDIFLNLLDHISDTTIENYIKEVGRFKLPSNIKTPDTEIFYLYGSKLNEILFKKSSKYLNKNYSNVETICLSGKGHCEDALLNSKQHCKFLENILRK